MATTRKEAVMEKKKFGAYIKECRLKKGYTQKELADLLFIDVTAVSKWERGITYPDITLISPICKYLEISEKELIESSNDTEQRKMQKDARSYNRIKDGIFYGLSIGYAVAVVTCFIVNVAVNHTLSWFFLVFFGCLTGFAFMPTCLRFIPSKYKLLGFIGSTYSALFLLFVCCSVYVQNYWFANAGMGTLIGYWVLFYPFVFFKTKFYLSDEKFAKLKKWFALTYLGGLTVLIELLLCCIYLYRPFALGKGLLVALVACMLLLAIGLICLTKTNAWIKVGACFVAFVFYFIGLDSFLFLLFGDVNNGESGQFYEVNFSDWNYYANGNIRLIMESVFLVFGLLFLTIGIIKWAKKRQKSK